MIRRTGSATRKSEVGGLIEFAETGTDLEGATLIFVPAIAVAELDPRMIRQSVCLRRRWRPGVGSWWPAKGGLTRWGSPSWVAQQPFLARFDASQGP
jgi:hypothetical protein